MKILVEIEADKDELIKNLAENEEILTAADVVNIIIARILSDLNYDHIDAQVSIKGIES